MIAYDAYPICMSDELIDIQSRIAHLERVNDELSDVLADVTKRLVKAESQLAALMDLAKDASEETRSDRHALLRGSRLPRDGDRTRPLGTDHA